MQNSLSRREQPLDIKESGVLFLHIVLVTLMSGNESYVYLTALIPERMHELRQWGDHVFLIETDYSILCL